jgi:hypothetical protein
MVAGARTTLTQVPSGLKDQGECGEPDRLRDCRGFAKAGVCGASATSVFDSGFGLCTTAAGGCDEEPNTNRKSEAMNPLAGCTGLAKCG